MQSISADSKRRPEVEMWSGKYLIAKRRDRWEYVSRARNIGAVVIVAVTDEDEIILVEQFRASIQAKAIEFPAGLVGDDSDAGEAPLVAAQRELFEETGFVAEHWHEAGTFLSSPGLTDESYTLVVARGLRRQAQGGGVGGEDITVHSVPLDSLNAFIAERRALGAHIDGRIGMLMLPALSPRR